MKHLLKIIEIQHLSKTGEVLWEDKNIHNLLHTDGEEFIIDILFAGEIVPVNYFFGLDNRTNINVSDDMETIETDGDEPDANGYLRQKIPSEGLFEIGLVDTVTQATTPILTFVAEGGSWGPVKNMFMTTLADNSGILISTVSLGQSINVSDGETINLRMRIALQDCISC